ncbi:MAG TPA: hypothetical protein VGW33_09440 [Terriglobia bacterium]|nr:hypothetical protein [Terriglobia bacterium]
MNKRRLDDVAPASCRQAREHPARAETGVTRPSDSRRDGGPTAYAELLAAYREMAADRQHEAEAQEWCDGLIRDGANGSAQFGSF